MPQKRSKFEFQEQATLSQQLASLIPKYAEYAGVDTKTAQAVAALNVFAKFGMIDPEADWFKLVKAILIERQRAAFATSERVNEITKMGMQMPRVRDIVELEPDDDD